MNYGYIRVSSKDQNEERQQIAMRNAGVSDECIFCDKQSGKDFDRPGWRRVMRRLKKGDVLFVKSIDRLGRNYDEILEQWQIITKKKGAAIVVLDMPMLDTREDRNLLGRVIADIVLQLLSYVAQTEREFIRQRQAEGIEAARARGVRLGREPLPIPDEFYEVFPAWERGELSGREGARRLGVSPRTFTKWARTEKNNVRTNEERENPEIR